MMENLNLVVTEGAEEQSLWTIAELSEELGKSGPTVKAWLDSMGITGQKRTGGSKGVGYVMEFPIKIKDLVKFKEEEEENFKLQQVLDKQGKLLEDVNMTSKCTVVGTAIETLPSIAKVATLHDALNKLDAKDKSRLIMETCMSLLQELNAEQAKNEALAGEVTSLTIKLDEHEDWASVKKMEAAKGKEFSWRPLKKYSKEHGYDIPKVPDANYEAGVNAYHKDVWLAVYNEWWKAIE